MRSPPRPYAIKPLINESRSHSPSQQANPGAVHAKNKLTNKDGPKQQNANTPSIVVQTFPKRKQAVQDSLEDKLMRQESAHDQTLSPTPVLNDTDCERSYSNHPSAVLNPGFQSHGGDCAIQPLSPESENRTAAQVVLDASLSRKHHKVVDTTATSWLCGVQASLGKSLQNFMANEEETVFVSKTNAAYTGTGALRHEMASSTQPCQASAPAGCTHSIKTHETSFDPHRDSRTHCIHADWSHVSGGMPVPLFDGYPSLDPRASDASRTNISCASNAFSNTGTTDIGSLSRTFAHVLDQEDACVQTANVLDAEDACAQTVASSETFTVSDGGSLAPTEAYDDNGIGYDRVCVSACVSNFSGGNNGDGVIRATGTENNEVIGTMMGQTVIAHAVSMRVILLASYLDTCICNACN